MWKKQAASTSCDPRSLAISESNKSCISSKRSSEMDDCILRRMTSFSVKCCVPRAAVLMCLLTLAGVLPAADGRGEKQVSPNVILIMVDDLGYNDLSSFGHPKIRTSVLDQLARDGIRLTQYYAGASVCTPSRMALLSGCYPTRVGWKQGVIGYKMGLREGMHPDVVTVAEIFQSAGYVTGISGKWHLGSELPCRPHRQGFESAYYIDKSNNQTTKLWRRDEILEDKFVNRNLTQQFTAEAIRFIEQNKDQRFFLYLPYTAPHFPVEPHPDWKGKSKFGAYGDVVEELDHRIGEILETLKTAGISQETIVLFCSDNGPQPGEAARAYPFRGMKWSSLEGGTRVPCVVRWPDRIPAGIESHALVTAMDLLPTLCEMAGIDWKSKVAKAQKVDGRDVSDLLLGTKTELPDRELLYWHGMGELQAIRKGKWKLFLNRSAAIQGLGVKGRATKLQQEALAELAQGQGELLMNIEQEADELTDCSADQPELVEQLRRLATRRLSEMNEMTVPLWKPTQKR